MNPVYSTSGGAASGELDEFPSPGGPEGAKRLNEHFGPLRQLSASFRDRSRESRRCIRLAAALAALVLLIAPLPFGAVHTSTRLVLQGILFVGAAVALPRLLAGVASLPQRGTIEARLPGILLILFATLLLSLASQLLSGVDHPVLGFVFRGLAPNAALSSLREYLAAATILLVTATALRFDFYRSSLKLARFVTFLAIGGAVLSSVVALIHWFYDSGRLFWLFSPEHVFLSTRARWPLVNPNHLAYLILPGYFLALGRLQIVSGEMVRLLTAFERGQPGHSQALSRWHGHLRTALLLLGAVVIVGTIIVATQSRSALLGLAAGLGTLFLFRLLVAPLAVRVNGEPDLSNPLYHRNRPPTRLRGLARRFTLSKEPDSDVSSVVRWIVLRLARIGTGFLFLIALGATAVFLSGHGVELLADRIDYGLVSGKDDVRWQLYRDTLRMIGDHPLFGVGLGNWASAYYPYMDRGLAGIVPDFLHSDILQTYAELGVFALPFFGVIIALLVHVALTVQRTVMKFRHMDDSVPSQEAEIAFVRVLSLGALTAAFAAVSIGLLFDFPLRIPAILYSWMVLLGLTIYHCDALSDQLASAPGESADETTDPEPDTMHSNFR